LRFALAAASLTSAAGCVEAFNCRLSGKSQARFSEKCWCLPQFESSNRS
jgi:hypothetical protein